jgi:hypothetical protein
MHWYVYFCRTGINNMVIAAFAKENISITNEYNPKQPVSVWHKTIRQAKFVLCPAGLSADSYRIWETLLLGSIPVVESNPAGLDRVYASLPVLVVRNFTQVTPSFLEEVYPCFVDHAAFFRYDQLRASYWLNLTRWAAFTGSVQHMTEGNPFRNTHCDFLNY